MGSSTHVSDGIDINVVFSVLGVGHERLNKEVSKHANNSLDLLLLAGSLLDPSSCLRPALVEAQKAALASSLDQLIRLCNEFRT